MAQRAGKLVLMEATAAEREELVRQSQAMPRRYRRYADNLRRLQERPPKDPRVGEAGIERAREAIRLAQAEGREA
jgi:hypothetical protein